MPLLAPLAVAAALALAGAPASPGTGCTATLSGKAKARFACVATVTTDAEGRVFLTLRAAAPVNGVPAVSPGSFELPAPPRVGTYGLDALGPGMASVAVEDGALFTASKTSSQRGEVTLALKQVRKAPAGQGGWELHGTYRARLVPAGAGREGEVVVEARF